MKNPLLSGIRILDLTRLLPGPFCTLYLAQLGAEVIKIEEPAGGDYARQMFPDVFEQVNRGKLSVTLDLRIREDVVAFHELAKDADVVIESFRPGVMDKLGCGYEVLKKINPKLVYAAVTGYGQTGPYRDVAGHDVNYLCFSGILDQIGVAGEAPALSNIQVADLAGGALTTAIGILGALIGARSSGAGAFVDVAMLDGALALQVACLAKLNVAGRTANRGEDLLTGALPNYRVYRCADGRYMAVGALEGKFFEILMRKLREETPPALAALLDAAVATPRDDDGTAQCLTRALAQVFATRDRDYWAAKLSKTDACTSPVLALEEALDHEHVVARGMLDATGATRAFQLPIRFDFPLKSLKSSPALGAHNGVVLDRRVAEKDAC